MAFEIKGLVEFGLEPAAELLTRGFSDYFVKIAFTAAGLMQMVKVSGLDPAASRVALQDAVPVGVALVERRGRASRLAGMAIIKESRKKGVGRAIVDRLVIEARGRGDCEMVLEVIEQNVPAVRLYEGAGFRKIRRLLGFEAAGYASPPGEHPLVEVSLGAAADAVLRYGLPDLPWQLSGETLGHLAPPSRAFRLEGAWVVLANPEASPVSIRGLVTESGPGAQGGSLRLLRALMERYPGKPWRIPALWPEELSWVFIQAGFIQSPMSQWQMALGIDSFAMPGDGLTTP